MTDQTTAPTGVVSSTELGLLPIGTRIVFTKTLASEPDEFSPGNLYARKGDGGVITGHGTREGYWVTWDGWRAPFGASRDEFEPEPNKAAATYQHWTAALADDMQASGDAPPMKQPNTEGKRPAQGTDAGPV